MLTRAWADADPALSRPANPRVSVVNAIQRDPLMHLIVFLQTVQ
jgi:hypothetical protein